MDGASLAAPSGNIVWLASYPKSGNTWVRIFLKNFLDHATSARQDINALVLRDGIACDRYSFDEIMAVGAAELDDHTVELLRPRVYEVLSREARRLLFIKAHEAYTLNPAGEPMFPAEATRGVLHIVRNPLDVAISFAHHCGCGIDESIERLCGPESCLAPSGHRLYEQLPQPLFDWSGHTESWLAAPLSRLTVRYEDLLAEPLRTFQAIVQFAGLTGREEDIRRAIDASRFERLRELEAERRFQEASPRAERFFRQGKSGGWRQVLTGAQVERIVTRHGRTMERFGYLDDLEMPPVPPGPLCG